MPATEIPSLVLPNSSAQLRMPVIGMGSALVLPNSSAQLRIAVTDMVSASDFTSKSDTKQAITEAIKQGYRHFDTAAAYGSEDALGEAIREALDLGLVSREELFVTSKLWCTDNHPHLVVSALRKSLRTLQLEYLDLYLIHWPISAKPGKFSFPIDVEDLMPLELKGVWEAMEECQRLGLTRAIGVSNFSVKKLQNLLSVATIPPAVNQVEMNLGWQQKKLREFCKEKGIIITAFSPLRKGTSRGPNGVMENEVVKEIAETRGKSIAQVCLRWLYEQGVTFAVKSYDKERMKQNLQIFDWTLTEGDHEKINQIHQQRLISGATKPQLSDLWDDEI